MNQFQICFLLALYAGTTHFVIATTSNNNNNYNKFGPLRIWRQDRFVRCIFCMNYDDYNNLNTYGCDRRRVATCLGNICYMRQHKKPEYFLYTSGCLNLTWANLVTVRAQISAQNNAEMPTATTTTTNSSSNTTTHFRNETQLCEVGISVNTCICADRDSCNNVTSVEPFVEYRDAIFSAINFDELAHFRHLLPNDPILNDFERGDRSTGGYILITNSSMASAAHQIIILIILSISPINFIMKNASFFYSINFYHF